jgi:hypothetical protein
MSPKRLGERVAGDCVSTDAIGLNLTLELYYC